MTPDEALIEYLGALGAERGLARNTVTAYRGDLRPYVATLVDSGRSDITMVATDDVDRFVTGLRNSSLAPSTVSRKISAVRGFHRFLVAEDLAANDPTGSLASPKRVAGLPKALSVEDVLRLLAAPDRSTTLGRRDSALVEFLYATGARVSEAVDLDLVDVDLVERIAVVTGKGSRQRVVPIGRHAISAIEDYLPVRLDLVGPRRDNDRLFVNARGGGLSRQGVWQVVRKHARTSGVAGGDVSPHVLRHSAATHMVEGGADLRIVQEMLGHASISTTQIYTRVSPQHLLEVYVSTHPRSR